MIARESYRYYKSMCEIIRGENGGDLTYFIQYYLELLVRALDVRNERQRKREQEAREREEEAREREQEVLRREREMARKPLTPTMPMAQQCTQAGVQPYTQASVQPTVQPYATPMAQPSMRPMAQPCEEDFIDYWGTPEGEDEPTRPKRPAPAEDEPADAEDDDTALPESPFVNTPPQGQQPLEPIPMMERVSMMEPIPMREMGKFYEAISKMKHSLSPNIRALPEKVRRMIEAGMLQFSVKQWADVTGTDAQKADSECRYLYHNGWMSRKQYGRLYYYSFRITTGNASDSKKDASVSDDNKSGLDPSIRVLPSQGSMPLEKSDNELSQEDAYFQESIGNMERSISSNIRQTAVAVKDMIARGITRFTPSEWMAFTGMDKRKTQNVCAHLVSHRLIKNIGTNKIQPIYAFMLSEPRKLIRRDSESQLRESYMRESYMGESQGRELRIGEPQAVEPHVMESQAGEPQAVEPQMKESQAKETAEQITNKGDSAQIPEFIIDRLREMGSMEASEREQRISAAFMKMIGAGMHSFRFEDIEKENNLPRYTTECLLRSGMNYGLICRNACRDKDGQYIYSFSREPIEKIRCKGLTETQIRVLTKLYYSFNGRGFENTAASRLCGKPDGGLKFHLLNLAERGILSVSRLPRNIYGYTFNVTPQSHPQCFLSEKSVDYGCAADHGSDHGSGHTSGGTIMNTIPLSAAGR